MSSIESLCRNSDCAVVLCADRNYFAPAYALALSLVRDQPERYDVYILTETGAHLNRVPSDVPVNILTPEFISRLPDIPELWEAVTRFGYLRLFAPEFIKGYRRLLYLDCDMRIDGSIAPLFSLDMSGKTIAAVDTFWTYCPTPVRSKALETNRNRQAMGLNPNDPYFNSGMLLIDCHKWRLGRMTDAAISCITRLGSTLRDDQDALNVIFRDAWLPLSLRWNFPSQLFETEIESIVNPIIYHNLLKPWKLGEARHREIEHFRHLIEVTPYNDFLQGRPSGPQIRRYIERRVKECIQAATFFVPACHERLQLRNPIRIQRTVAKRVIENVRSQRYADVNQNISHIDVGALSTLIHAR